MKTALSEANYRDLYLRILEIAKHDPDRTELDTLVLEVVAMYNVAVERERMRTYVPQAKRDERSIEERYDEKFKEQFK